MDIEIPEKYFIILYRLIRKQNEVLLKEIAKRENLSYNVLAKRFMPSHTALRQFLNHHHHRHLNLKQISS